MGSQMNGRLEDYLLSKIESLQKDIDPGMDISSNVVSQSAWTVCPSLLSATYSASQSSTEVASAMLSSEDSEFCEGV